MSKIIPQEYDTVLLKTGEMVGLIDQMDETHFLPDYGVEIPEQEEKTLINLIECLLFWIDLSMS